jgi:hypothetical protein
VALVLYTTSPKDVPKIQMKPPMILVGKWANYDHCNTNILIETKSKRKTWTLHLDKRTFCTSVPMHADACQTTYTHLLTNARPDILAQPDVRNKIKK